MEARTQAPYTSLNKWFLIPFILWVIFGGIIQLIYSKEILFEAINLHHSSVLDVAMFYITKIGEGVIGTVILLILLGVKSYRNWWYFTAALVSNVFPVFIVQWVKNAVDAPRPLNYFHQAAWIHILPTWDKLFDHSFPSGHTCGAFTLFCFLAFLLTPKYKWLGIVFFLLGLLVGYSRVYLAAHFFLDVYVGSIIGVVFTILVITIMQKKSGFFFRKPINTNS